jgi:hypothetical protein
MSEEKIKDIAISTAYFSSLFTENLSFFNSIDEAYDLAILFVDKYPPKTNWGIDEGLEYEETLEGFYEEYLLYKNSVREKKCLFQYYTFLPTAVKEEIDLFNRRIEVEAIDSYKACSLLINSLEKNGWTCEYELDGIPFNLRKKLI